VGSRGGADLGDAIKGDGGKRAGPFGYQRKEAAVFVSRGTLAMCGEGAGGGGDAAGARRPRSLKALAGGTAGCAIRFTYAQVGT
jgi:hypothetical protein